MNAPPAPIDRRAARARFDRAAQTYARAACLEAEVATRMLDRLDYMRIAPRRVLDAGAGLARETRRLARRYPGADLYALDSSLAMLRAGRRAAGWLARLPGVTKSRPVCADLAQLPLADASMGLVWSNMALHWVAEPLAALKEFWRVLEPGGLLMFSTLGPDTLRELRAAAGAQRVHDFLDMHDLGDRMVAAGFYAPVMDMEMITVTYADVTALLAALRASGQTNVRQDRARGLRGTGFLAHLRTALNAGMREGRIPATFEILQGHAWKGERATATSPSAARPVRVVPRALRRE